MISIGEVWLYKSFELQIKQNPQNSRFSALKRTKKWHYSSFHYSLWLIRIYAHIYKIYIRLLLCYKKEYKVTFWELSYRMSSHSWMGYNSLFNSAAESFYCITILLHNICLRKKGRWLVWKLRTWGIKQRGTHSA